MFDIYQDEIIKKIGTIVNTKAYAGELNNPQDGLFLQQNLPCVFVDFIEDDTSDVHTSKVVFSLYIVHISYSKNELNRAKVKKELFTLLKDIYKAIAFKPILDSKPIRLTKLKKIFDAVAKGGYLTVYKKDIHIDIPNPLLK